MPRAQSKNRVQVYFEDRDLGYRRMATDLGGVTSIELGVFGAKAKKRHGDSDLSVGTVAAMHELGLGGMQKRSFIRAWMDKNTQVMWEQAREMLIFIARGGSRMQAGKYLGMKWAGEIKNFIATGQVQPPNSPLTIERKGHAIPMIGLTHEVISAIDYKVKLPQTRSMKGTPQNAAKRALEGLVSLNADVPGQETQHLQKEG